MASLFSFPVFSPWLPVPPSLSQLSGNCLVRGGAHFAKGLLPRAKVGPEGQLPALRAERSTACPVLHASLCLDPTSEFLVPF